MKRRLGATIAVILMLALATSGCSSNRYVPPPNVTTPVDPQVAMQRQIVALSANMSGLQAQITRNNSQITELSRLNDSLVAQVAALKRETTANASSPAQSVPVATTDILNRLAAVEAKATAVDINEKTLDASTKTGLKAADDNLNTRLSSLSNQIGLLYTSKSDVAGWQNYMIQLDSRLQAVEKKLGLR